MESNAPGPILGSASDDGVDDLSAELPFSLEKRTTERSTITLRVDYKRLNTFFADYTKNISKGGTFIRTAKPLDVGTKFVFVLSFPSREGQLRLKGEVMWTVTDDRATEDQPPGMGIRFLFNDDDEREKVAVFVEKLMAEALGEHISSRLLKRPLPAR
ncbi:TIGR02266 family protein [Pendulispora albinea]|uniref:TIGR02266 family protein n=1 Tax=Pendulispora albinea TaxID=2741071 RepID=A0ABZ2LPZ2_9BACT